MEQEEIWKDVVGYEGLYQVSNLGRVKSLGNEKQRIEKILKPHKLRTGYLLIHLYKNGTPGYRLVHRLVATAFIPNDNIFAATVNHKNEVKTDNRAENLEWMSSGDNTRYSCAGPYGNKSSSKNYHAKQVRCIETGEVFDCAADASRFLGIAIPCVANSIRKGYRCAGYHWEYVEQDKQTKQQQ